MIATWIAHPGWRITSGRSAFRGGWAAGVAAVLVSGCAHIEAPPGGEEDTEPPVLVSVNPDTLAVVAPFRDPVVFTFDERLSEQGVEDAVLVSPQTSELRVGKSGHELRVSLGEGWETGLIYQIIVTPTLQDLWNNTLLEPVRHVFSTGPEIPETRVVGRVVDLVTGEPELEARVEALRTTDSLTYAVLADSSGGFVFDRIPEGDYVVRAYRELNPNRELDDFEPQDTASVAVVAADTPSVTLAIVLPDSTPPEVASATYADGVIEVRFDDYLDPAQSFSPTQIRITGPGGTALVPERVSVGMLESRDTAAADTTLQDTALVDTIPPDTVGRDTAVVDTAAADTLPPGTPEATGPLPSQSLAVGLAEELAAGTEYTITIQGARNVVGLSGGGEATFTTPPAAQEPPSEDEPVPEPPG